MLAQNFKSASDLDLSNEAFSAFVKVLGLLEREEIPEHLFTMMHVGEPQLGDCGTPGCILGWARYVSPTLKDQCWSPRIFQPVYKLCFPDEGRWTEDRSRFLSCYMATRSQAASALRNFLTYGEPRWSEVLS